MTAIIQKIYVLLIVVMVLVLVSLLLRFSSHAFHKTSTRAIHAANSQHDDEQCRAEQEEIDVHHDELEDVEFRGGRYHMRVAMLHEVVHPIRDPLRGFLGLVVQ